MTRLIALLILGITPILAFSDDNAKPADIPPTVTIESKGLDVRGVIHDLFAQSKQNYVLEPNVRFVLYLSVKDIDFDEALQIVCKLANLEYQVQNGIYYIGPKKPADQPKAQPRPEPAAPPKPLGTLPASVLNRRVTTRLSKASFKAVLAELSKQSNVSLELDPELAKLRLDAFFNNSSLKYVLDTITEAGGFKYRFTDRLSIEIYQPKPAAEENRVTLYRD